MHSGQTRPFPFRCTSLQTVPSSCRRLGPGIFNLTTRPGQCVVIGHLEGVAVVLKMALSRWEFGARPTAPPMHHTPRIARPSVTPFLAQPSLNRGQTHCIRARLYSQHELRACSPRSHAHTMPPHAIDEHIQSTTMHMHTPSHRPACRCVYPSTRSLKPWPRRWAIAARRSRGRAPSTRASTMSTRRALHAPCSTEIERRR